jgi:hypothetical protein
MVEKTQDLERSIFKNFIQSNIEIYTLDAFNKRSVLKTGKLVNFNIKLPFIYFIIESKLKSKEFVLPQPFKYALNVNNEMILSFRLKDSVIDEEIVDKMKKLGMISESKIYNKLIYIKIS